MTEGSWAEAALAAVRAGTARISVVGCGYVGLTLAVEHARTGSTVVGIETSEARAKELRAGTNPVPDVAIEATELVALRDAGTLTARPGGGRATAPTRSSLRGARRGASESARARHRRRGWRRPS